MHTSGEAGDWVALYLPFASTTNRVDYTLGETINHFTAPENGGAYLPNRVICVADAPFTPEDDGWISLDPDWLPSMGTKVEHYISGSGYCSGPDIRGVLFVLGGTMSWSYQATYTFEGVNILSPVSASGSDMQSWSLDLATLQAAEPALTSATFSTSTAEEGWLHAEVEQDPIGQLAWTIDGNAGAWEGEFPSGRTMSKQFVDLPIFSSNGWIAMGGFHEPAGTATLTIDMASLEPGARIFFAHVPHLLDAFPFLGTNYNG